MISCFKGSATDDWKSDFENNHAALYTSTSDLTGRGPKISEIVESFKKYDVIKYAAYRTAFKIRTIQKASKLHLIDLAVINTVLKEFHGSSSLDTKTTTESATETMCALYSEANKRIGFAADPDVMAHLFCALLKNAFLENENSLLLLQMTVTLVLFSSAKLSEKHKYMFYHCSSDGIMSKNNLSLLLQTLSKLAEIVGEQVTFGSHLVPNAVKNCLKYCKGRITEKRFKKWLALDPQTLVWLSTLHRIAIAERTEHYITCDFCQTSPTVGLRYKCLQCMNYNLCQNCFLRGCYNKGHKEGHFVQEFCLPATVWQETKATFNAVKNRLPFTKCPSKPYLSFDDESLCNSSEVLSNPSIQRSAIRNCSLRKSTSAYLIKELSSIISQLEEEKKQITALESTKENKMMKQLNGLKASNGNLPVKEDFQKTDSNFDAQLERLKELVKALKTPHTVKKETGVVSPVPHVPFHRKDLFFESTPMNSVAPLQSKENFQSFSPQSVDTTRILSKKPYNQSSDYSSQSFSSDKENFAFSSTYNPSKSQSDSISLELTTLLNKSSPKGISTKLSELSGDISKLSPLYICSSLDLEEAKSGMVDELSPPVSPNKDLRLSSKFAQSTFTLNKDGSLEIMEQELQAMIQHLEGLLPQVSGETEEYRQTAQRVNPPSVLQKVLANDSRVEKERVISALSEMEEAVQKLSHLSFEMSTGSTDL